MEPSSPPPPTQAPVPSLCEEAGPLPPEAQSGMEQLWVPRKVAPNKEEGGAGKGEGVRRKEGRTEGKGVGKWGEGRRGGQKGEGRRSREEGRGGGVGSGG